MLELSLPTKLGKQPVFGILNSLLHPLLVEMIACAGYDFIILDMEHLPHDEERLQHCIHLAQSHGCAPLVRVPDAAAKRIGRVLDLGAHGIVLPQVESIAEVTAARDAMRFPPLGRRGITGGGVTGFGTRPLDAYCRQANQGLMLIPMIESAAGLAILDDLLALDGVAMILEGALDMALSLGLGAQPTHPQVTRQLRRIARRCRAAGVPFCANPRSERQRDYWLRSGIDAWLCGEDRGLLFRALRQRRDDLRTAASRGPRATDLSL
ncbi:HpcH/HpaI aldolase [Edwardsiella anguillarum]|uniref:HpcH/HpaI aldolase family protein n=1 Tax=Edwardsiella TaxID=635 RepID=UPI00045D2989|nr:aldolase/citrate lyase family protein [Edwardsiella anguillarum]AKM47700.1 4-hydroxy-2-oxovalerate aldolase [Edwardsiella sp. EA181011]GAJ68675.1 4-hydroxy-2-oxovalerate aldolase [Edwardsiella piscicida]RFT01827.1 4-hydroxy-2-oxovalerate aldolase [Edwardsiella anguillarum]BET84421.1 HpcH/HpaI aldolase [Edwardsiella anguillarum]BET87787.1 HpcH/HpaI aldolase [Edwardsiella anguillarum]